MCPSVSYGVVVDNVNVSVLLYVPVRSGSAAPIACLNSSDTGSFEIGLSDLSTYTDLGGAAGNQTYASCKPTDGAGVVDRIDVRGWPVP